MVVFTTDLVDDAGVSAAARVRRLLDDLEVGCELVVLDPVQCRATPRWSAVGPRLDALPAVNATTAGVAAWLGVGRLLSGDGADELLGVPRFATAEITRRWGPRGGWRYARDVATTGPGTPGEVMAVACRVLPDRWAVRCYWAVNWPQWCDPPAPVVLTDRYRQVAAEWSRAWVKEQLTGHTMAGRSSAAADARDAWWPHDPIPPAGSVAEASPFLHEAFLPVALGSRIADRYDPRLGSPYLRCKATVVGLLPPRARPVLPGRKRYYTHALATIGAGGVRAPLGVAAGLFNPDALVGITDPATALTVAAVEQWLHGARAAGAVIPTGQGTRV
ncbi:MAG: hypothetical protein HYR62_04845 [Actinobacteria bacterium]|nr:hypothetical protein [Actinomycetota bacterium]